MHTNEIITDMVGGLLGKKRYPSCHISPLVRLWLTCSRYMGIKDNRPPLQGDLMSVLGIISGMI